MIQIDIAALVEKLSSQIGDDIQVIFNHESLFKQSRAALIEQAETIKRLTADLARVTAERDAERAVAEIVEYVLQDDLHNRLTPRVVDIAYSAFMAAKCPNSEDGGPSDWFTDTKPMVMRKIAEIRAAYAKHREVRG